MDNPDPVNPGNPDPAVAVAEPPVVTPTNVSATPGFSWKSQLSQDFAGSPTMQLFADTKEGFNDSIKSHLSLVKLLGHEKVPIPKGKDDVEAWSIYSKAMGIPDKPDGYALPEVNVPEVMQGLKFDKAKFAEVVHEHKLTPSAAKGLWNTYTEMSMQAYANALKANEEKLTGIVNQMRQEWGDAYNTKVELGQMVINKFSENQETNDFVTAVLSQDPRGIKFLSTIGNQFAENKIGDFKYQRHSLTPDEAQNEIDSIRRDSKHPYNNEKMSQIERDKAIDYVNSLISVARKPRG